VAKPLAGRTVVVTRPRRQAAGFVVGLKGAGATVIEAPMIRVAPPSSYAGLDAALRKIASFDATVFTSRNAVESFFDRAGALGIAPPPRPRRLFAVGPMTAAALRERGWRACKTPATFRGEALARALGVVRGQRFLLPRAKVAGEALAKILRRGGAKLTLVEAYRTLPERRGLAPLKKALANGVDAVTFTSGSAVREFCSQLGLPACRRLFKRAVAASIGPVTSAALKAQGLAPGVQARRATASSLLSALKRHFRGARA